MPHRKIIHVDMDCFYAAVECRDNPKLRGKPIAVGSANGRGVLTTANYEARAFGVRSAMPSREAMQRCPQLIIVPSRMPVYREVSQQIHALYQRYTERIEPLSLDEAFLDVTTSTVCQGSATRIAQQLRQDIWQETGLTASAGIANCKFIAKIASDENKPNGQFVVLPHENATFCSALSLRKFPGVGPKTAARLAQLGMTLGADVLPHSAVQLQQWFGQFGMVLHQRARGIDPRPVVADKARKSVGVENTFKQDIYNETECLIALQSLQMTLLQRLQGRPIKGVSVKLKFSDFQQTTVACQSQQIDAAQVRSLMQMAYQRGEGRGVRLVGLTAILATQNTGQLSLW
ncbi:MAG: DNA polymerase IV [Ferrimonas sp.]